MLVSTCCYSLVVCTEEKNLLEAIVHVFAKRMKSRCNGILAQDPGHNFLIQCLTTDIFQSTQYIEGGFSGKFVAKICVCILKQFEARRFSLSFLHANRYSGWYGVGMVS